MAQEQRVQRLKHIVSPHPGANRHSQRLPRVLVQDGQHLVAPTVVELVVHEVDGPDVIGMGRAQPNDRAVLVIEPSALSVPLRQLKALFAPDQSPGRSVSPTSQASGAYGQRPDGAARSSGPGL